MAGGRGGGPSGSTAYCGIPRADTHPWPTDFGGLDGPINTQAALMAASRNRKRRGRKRPENRSGQTASDLHRDGQSVAGEPAWARRPMQVARALSALMFVLGGVMLVLGVGVVSGSISEGWGFPMSAVSNWGRPWGVVLVLAAAAYLIGPVLLYVRPRTGVAAMMVIAGLSVVLGVPLVTTTAEILYNLFQETKSRPMWVDSVWGYSMIVNVGICVALYRACPPPSKEA